jgi:hypothetical protein
VRLTFWVDLALLAPAAFGLLTMPEPVVTRSGLRLRPQRWRFPAELRATFAEAAVAAFAGAAVLGLFTAVSPAFLGQTLGVTNRAAVGLVVFVVFAASTLGQASLQFVVGDETRQAGQSPGAGPFSCTRASMRTLTTSAHGRRRMSETPWIGTARRKFRAAITRPPHASQVG